MSPLMRRAFLNNESQCLHDPFKSDIYSLGLIFLEIASAGAIDIEKFQEVYKNNKKLDSAV